jgi:hypothetical protein
MPTSPTTPKPQPVGHHNIRLADIPDEIRIAAARKLMNEAKDIHEWARLVELAYAPGDAGGRIAA